MRTEERKLEDILGEKFKAFENALKAYMKKQKVTEDWEKFISCLSIKLCVWTRGELGESVCLPDGQVPFMVSSSKVNYLEDSEDHEDKASYFYRQACGECTDAYFDRIHINKNLCYNSVSKNAIIPGVFDALWIVSCNRKTEAASEIIIKVMLDFLKKCTGDLNIIEKADKDFWEKKEQEYKFNIMKWYMKRVFKEGEIPDSKTITRIAWKNYESKENKSKMIFVGEQEKERCIELNTGVLLFEEGNRIEIGEEGKKLTNIRKMLETCSKREDKGCCLLADNKKPYPLFGIITEDSFKELNELDGRFWLIEFMGNGDWMLFKGKDPVLIYQRGEFLISQSQKEVEINNLVTDLGDKTKQKVTKEKERVFAGILERLMKQKHGALLIISDDAKDEAEILCRKFKRGTSVNRIDLSEEGNLPLLDGIAAVDGAVLVDFSGVCYGFGVILDGDAKVEGDTGRGARYNSALNYVAGKERYAVVVSEDKENPIQIVGPEEKKVLSRKIG